MKGKGIIITFSIIAFFVLLAVGFVVGTNEILTEVLYDLNLVCSGQKFSSAEEAIQAMEKYERDNYDISLDFCPPYKLLYSFEYDKNTIVFYSCRDSFDSPNVRQEYAVRILKHNKDGTLSFDSGFAVFDLKEPNENNNHFDCTNIHTSKGTKSISFLYLDKDSDKEIYVDGHKAEKRLVNIEGREFYICYAISGRDTFLKSLFTPISERHKIEY